MCKYIQPRSEKPWEGGHGMVLLFRKSKKVLPLWVAAMAGKHTQKLGEPVD